jgi:hypothetical protein
MKTVQNKKRKSEIERLAMENPGVHWQAESGGQVACAPSASLDPKGLPSPAESEIDLLDTGPDFESAEVMFNLHYEFEIEIGDIGRK